MLLKLSKNSQENKMKIIENKNNELLNRKEVKLIIEAEKNPSVQEATETVSKEFKSEEDSLAIKTVKGKFGRNTFLITANIYKNKEAKEKIEPKLKKKKGAKEKPAEQLQPAQAEQPAAAEQKPEEKQEENKE